MTIKTMHPDMRFLLDAREKAGPPGTDVAGLTLEGMIMFRAAYPGAEDTEDAYAMPIKAKDLGRLPPALVHTAEPDPIRDDGREYAARLAQAVVWVTYREARGMIHGFLRARLAGPGAKAEFDAICRFLGEHLDGPVGRT
ncbi:MAG: alpha/beta hydrolase fold domain-containing protein [Alphaproteobacteria bacterium]